MIRAWFWRELTTSSLLIVCLSLILAFATLFSLGNLNDRIMQGLGQQNREFLAGDRVLRASYPIAPDWLTQAQSLNITVSQQLAFSTMAYAHDKLQLIDVKAVDESYPLYGELLTEPAALKPTPGQLLVEAKLLLLLGVQIGDQIEVGDTVLTISGVLKQEPDARFNLFQTAPRALMSWQDAEKTGAIQLGSRLTYRYMFKGDTPALSQLDNLFKPNLRADQRWSDLNESGSNAVNRALERAKLFLLLSTVLVLALAATAIVVAMNHYSRSRYDLMAILKTLGANRKNLAKLILGQWLVILILAISLGSLLGLGLEALLFYLLQTVLPATLPAAGFMPWFNSLLFLVVLSGLIGVRPYVQLLATPPVRVLRQDSINNRWPLRYYIPLTVLILLGLLLLIVGFNPIWWSLLLGVIGLGALLGVLGWGGLTLLRQLSLANLALRLASNRLLRNPLSTLSQLGTFSLSLMLLTLLMMVRGGLLERWQASIPADSPNYFMLNIAPEQYEAVERYFAQHQVTLGHTFPIVRARLTEINGQPAQQRVAEGEPGYGTISRELNLTWYDDVQPYNLIAAGQWPPQVGEVSVSLQQAEELKVSIGDKLTFLGNAQPFTATISSLRKVDWETMKPNFVFIFDKMSLAAQPQYGFTSFRYQGDEAFLIDFNRHYPTIMLMDINDILTQIASLLAQITQTLELIVLLVLLCGILLLSAQLQVGMQQRRQELRVYRILGAKIKLLRTTLWSEFFMIGTVSGLIAVFAAELALYFLQTRVFDFVWQANYALWIMVPLLSGALFSSIGGVLGVRLLAKDINRTGDSIN